MPDRERVIKGMIHHKDGCIINGDLCPYWTYEQCNRLLFNDALTLLKEQDNCENCAIAIEDRQLVVRCKDCKYWHDPINCQMDSEGMKTSGDWFCADAKRR